MLCRGLMMAPCSWNMLPWWYVCILTVKWCVRLNKSHIHKSSYTSGWITLRNSPLFMEHEGSILLHVTLYSMTLIPLPLPDHHLQHYYMVSSTAQSNLHFSCMNFFVLHKNLLERSSREADGINPTVSETRSDLSYRGQSWEWPWWWIQDRSPKRSLNP